MIAVVSLLINIEFKGQFNFDKYQNVISCLQPFHPVTVTRSITCLVGNPYKTFIYDCCWVGVDPSYLPLSSVGSIKVLVYPWKSKSISKEWSPGIVGYKSLLKQWPFLGKAIGIQSFSRSEGQVRSVPSDHQGGAGVLVEIAIKASPPCRSTRYVDEFLWKSMPTPMSPAPKQVTTS